MTGRKKKVLAVGLPLLLLLAGGAGLALLILTKPHASVETPQRPVPVLEAVRVEPEPVQISVKSQGNVRPQTETALTPEVSGRIEEVSPKLRAGAFFEEGDVLIRIDPVLYEVALAEAQASLAQADLALEEERARAEQARREFENLGQGTPTDLVLRKPQLRQAEAALASAKSRLRQARINLERTQIRAPYEGRVREKNVDIGQYVTAGPGTVLARLYSTDAAEVRLPLSDGEMALLRMPFEVRGPDERVVPVDILAEFGDELYAWPGSIRRTEGAVDERSRLRYAVAEVEEPYANHGNPSLPPLKPGMFVGARIYGPVREDVFVVPSYALIGNREVVVLEERDLGDAPLPWPFKLVPREARRELLKEARERLAASGVPPEEWPRWADPKLKVVSKKQVRAIDADSNLAVVSGLESGDLVNVSPIDVLVEGATVRPRLRTFGELELAEARARLAPAGNRLAKTGARRVSAPGELEGEALEQ